MVVAAEERFVSALEHSLSNLNDNANRSLIKSDLGNEVPGAFIVHNVLSESECLGLEQIVRDMHSTDLSFHKDDLKRDPRRESQHHLACWVSQQSLVELCHRLDPFLPKTAGPNCVCPIEQGGSQISNFLRAYCYQMGDFSSPHFDRSYRTFEPEGNRLDKFSAYSVVLYLNDNFQGGETTFFQHDPNLPKSKKGNTPLVSDRNILKVSLRVQPRKGDALIFPHGSYPGCFPDPLHEGSILKEGSKCILRTDIVFRFKALTGVKRQKIGIHSPPAEKVSAKTAVEDILREAVAQISASLAHFPEGSISFCEGQGSVEMKSTLPNKLFWALYRENNRKLFNECGENLVEITSDFGLTRQWTRLGLANEILANVQNTKHFAFLGVEPTKCFLLFNSKAFQMLQSDRGLVMCEQCGQFVKARNGGLEWHLKLAHNVKSHAVAFQAVERMSDAIVSYISSPSEGIGNPVPNSLDPMHMQVAIHDRAFLEESVKCGRIKSLGPFLDACRSGNIEKVEAMIQTGTDPCKELDKNGTSGLLWAAGFGNLEVCRFLVSNCHMDPLTHFQGARRGYSGRHSLHWAARNGHLPVIKWLVDELHFPVDKPSSDGTTALSLAVWQGHLETVRFLVEHCKANVLAVNSFGCNLAMWGCQGQSEETLSICKYLFDAGVSFERINANGQGCLHKAAQRGNIEVCKWLVEDVKVGEEHFRPNADEKSTPSDLARFAGFGKLSEYLKLYPAVPG